MLLRFGRCPVARTRPNSQATHPDVEAVSVGAILSSYQRVRVEQV